MKKLNYLFTGLIALVLMLGLCFYLTKSNNVTVHATELEAIDGADLNIKLKVFGKTDFEITFEDGPYLHLHPDNNQADVNDSPEGADMEYSDGILRIYDTAEVDEYDDQNIGIYALNATDKKLTIMLYDSMPFDAVVFPKGDLTITTPSDINKTVNLHIYHRVVISGTLTLAGHIYFDHTSDFSWDYSINDDATANITAGTLQLLDNATLNCQIIGKNDKYAVKVNNLTINTNGSVFLTASTDKFLQALFVDSEKVNLINFKQIVIRATDQYGTQKEKLTNVQALCNAADTPIENIYATCERENDDWVLRMVPNSSLHTISFDANGGAGSMADVENVSYNYTAPKCEFTAPEGKKFYGWAIGSPDSEEVVRVGNKFSVTEDTTLYAIWMNQVPLKEQVLFGYMIGVGGKPSDSAYSYDQENGILTICDDFNYDILVSGSKGVRSDLQIVFDGVHVYGVSSPDNNRLFITNCYGDITLENKGEEVLTVYLMAVYTDYSLTIKGNLNVILTGTNNENYKMYRQNPEKGLIFAKEKLSVLGNVSLDAIDPSIPANCQGNSAIIASGSIEIDTTGKVEIGTKTKKYGDNKNVGIFIFDAKPDNVWEKFTIRECGKDGYLKLYRYNASNYYFCTGSKDSSPSINDYDFTTKLRYYAQYSALQDDAKLLCFKPCYIDFDNNDATGEMKRVYARIGDVYTLPECAFTAPDNYVFDGWGIGSNKYEPGNTLEITSDDERIIVSPIWVTKLEHINYIDMIQLSGPTNKDVKEGNLSAFTVEAKTNHVSIKAYGDGTCWVYWNTSTNKWSEFDGEAIAVADGTRYGIKLACVLDTGFEFADSAVIAIYNSTTYDVSDTNDIVKRNTWGGYIYINLGEAHHVYTVTYYPNGGTGTEITFKGLIAGQYSLKTYSALAFEPRSGKQFKGWSYTFDGEIIDTATITLDSDKVLYAIWEDSPDVQYTVTFNANGGSGKMANVQYAGAYTLPVCEFSAPSGKEFAGWATSSDGEVIITSTITINSDTALFAKWKDKEVSQTPSETQQPASHSKGLSAGAVVLIVIASCVVAGAGGFAVYWFIIKKKTWADFVQIFKKK